MAYLSEKEMVQDCGFEEGSDEWWADLSKKLVGNTSSSTLDHSKSNFQMSRKTFDYICSLVKNDMTTSKAAYTFTNGNPVPFTHQVAIALRRLGSGDSLKAIGESFGIHNYIVSRVTMRFMEAIEEDGVHHIQWPSRDEMSEIKCKFEKIQGLPNCCGAVDMTHVKMHFGSTNQEGDLWIDRSGSCSMILQAIVDPDLRFRDLVTGWPGKLSDSLVLQSSGFFKLCQEGERLNSLSENMMSREYIVGDSGFPLLSWLVTPFQGNELSGTEVEFNKRLLATHGVACKALSRLKEFWRIIGGEVMKSDKKKLPTIILVCCILHNIVIDMEEDGIPCEMAYDPLNHGLGYVQDVCEHVDEEGSSLRKSLCKHVSAQ